jgi:acetyl-CoA acetyltransferase family protein
MSRAPWVLLKPDRGYARTNETVWSTTLGWRMVNPHMPSDWTISLGEGAELLAAKYAISRDEQDAFALRSHRLAAAAWDAGRYAGEVVPVDGIDLDRDECVRPDASLEALARLRPAFRPDGTVTAGNASPLNDGAAAVLLGDAEGARRAGRQPVARIVSRGVSAVEPPLYGIGPVAAANAALARAGIGWNDLAVVELNEAFAAQSLACLRELGLPDDAAHVNPNGGAIALGHPLGASGARLALTAALELRERDARRAVATMCIGVGQGIALLLERA